MRKINGYSDVRRYILSLNISKQEKELLLEFMNYLRYYRFSPVAAYNVLRHVVRLSAELKVSICALKTVQTDVVVELFPHGRFSTSTRAKFSNALRHFHNFFEAKH